MAGCFVTRKQPDKEGRLYAFRLLPLLLGLVALSADDSGTLSAVVLFAVSCGTTSVFMDKVPVVVMGLGLAVRPWPAATLITVPLPTPPLLAVVCTEPSRNKPPAEERMVPTTSSGKGTHIPQGSQPDENSPAEANIPICANRQGASDRAGPGSRSAALPPVAV